MVGYSDLQSILARANSEQSILWVRGWSFKLLDGLQAKAIAICRGSDGLVDIEDIASDLFDPVGGSSGKEKLAHAVI